MSNPTTTTAPLAGRMPEEVVTASLVRDVVLPRGAGTMALVTIDNGFDHTKPTTFGPAGLAGLAEALGAVAVRAKGGEISSVGVTGKPFIFAAGADLKMAALSGDRDEALDLARFGHAVFQRLSDAGVPSFAFVNGLALGGGVEFPLYATYRTISAGVPAFGLPECFLGLVPGWGGTYLLPNLVGPEKALELIIGNPMSNNKMINGPQARALGYADAMFEPADFLEQSLLWAADVLTGTVSVERPEIDRTESVWEAALKAAKKAANNRVGGAAPAPYRAIELVRLARTADRATVFEAESQALADVSMSEEFRSGLYAFDLVNRRAKKPAGVPSAAQARPMTEVGIVGAGLMASQLALLFVRRLQVPVVMTDLDEERVAKGVAWVETEIEKLRVKGRLSGDAANRLTALVSGSTAPDAFAGCSLVIEAVFEDMSVKKKVFADVEKVVSPECILATNTSSLSVTQMGADLAHPERVVGFHVFNPVAVMPLVEIVRGEQTDDAALATAFAVGKQLKKTCVLVKDAPAFIVNRLLNRFIGEVVRALDEGTPADVTDRALAPLGLPMSPFTLLQLVGPAVALHVSKTLRNQLGDRFHVSPSLEAIVRAGKPGVWSWGPDGRPYLAQDTAALLVQGDAPLTSEQVLARALDALAQEIRMMLDEGVAQAAQDVDLCMIMGANWPFHLGGITPYLDRSGVAERVAGQRFLPIGVASVPL